MIFANKESKFRSQRDHIPRVKLNWIWLSFEVEKIGKCCDWNYPLPLRFLIVTASSGARGTRSGAESLSIFHIDLWSLPLALFVGSLWGTERHGCCVGDAVLAGKLIHRVRNTKADGINILELQKQFDLSFSSFVFSSGMVPFLRHAFRFWVRSSAGCNR